MGLTFPQYLAVLALLDSSPQTVGTLGTRLDMDTGTITPLVKRLEAAGMDELRQTLEDLAHPLDD